VLGIDHQEPQVGLTGALAAVEGGIAQTGELVDVDEVA